MKMKILYLLATLVLWAIAAYGAYLTDGKYGVGVVLVIGASIEAMVIPMTITAEKYR